MYLPTMELRYIKKSVPYNGNPTIHTFVDVLQQKYICQSYGNIEWRDVPTVDNDDGKE